MGARILVTRPEPGASRTAARLRARGIEPVVVPLVATVTLQAQLPANGFAAAIVSSANAVTGLPAEFMEKSSALPLFAVGDETAAAARRAGFTDVRSSEGSAADLVRDVAAAVGRRTRILYLCGRVRRDVIETQLAGMGIEVDAVETYDTRLRSPSSEELAALADAPIAAALVFSAQEADALAILASNLPGTILAGTTFVAISERVADRLGWVASGCVVSASSPDEEAMFRHVEFHEQAAFKVNLI